VKILSRIRNCIRFTTRTITCYPIKAASHQHKPPHKWRIRRRSAIWPSTETADVFSFLFYPRATAIESELSNERVSMRSTVVRRILTVNRSMWCELAQWHPVTSVKNRNCSIRDRFSVQTEWSVISTSQWNNMVWITSEKLKWLDISVNT